LQSRIRRSALFIAPALIAVIAVSSYALSRAPFATPVAAANLFDGGSDQARITAAVRRDKPSVVALEVYVNGTRYVPTDIFGNTEQQTVEGRASGSGFVYDTNGTIVTNSHVISPPRGGQVEKIDVLFANGDRIPGHVVSVNRSADLALVKVDGYGKLPVALTLGDSKKVEAGQWAIAIGEPLELRQTVTVGVVSGFDRSEPIGDEDGGEHTFTGLLQTSAPINPGNSGGPLIDMAGRVIGINQSVAGGAQGIGFAIPVDTIRADVAAMLNTPAGTSSGAVAASPAVIGVQLAPVAAIRSQINYDGQGGVAVQAVTAGGPADSAGIAPGDVIQQIDGHAVDSPQAAATAIHAHQPGQTVAVQLWRNGSQTSVVVQTSATPPQVGMQGPDDSSQQAQPDPDADQSP
jgi:S1-C subfamily serine protease